LQKVIVLRGALAAALAVFILTSASGEARRVHDPDKATKIRTERTTNAPKNKSLTYNYICIIIRAIRVSHTQLRQLAGFVGD